MRSFELTNRFDDTYSWHGVDFELNMMFDNVLLLFDLLEDQGVSYALKMDIALEMLIVNTDPLDQLEGNQAMELILDILRDKLNMDLRAERDEEADPPIPTYDFKEDAERIYASFLFDYQIDLFEQQGRMHWAKFLALFSNLSGDSPIGKAIHFRTCEVPKKDKHNEEERKHIISMKKQYELKAVRELLEERKAKELAASFDRMKTMLRKGG